MPAVRNGVADFGVDHYLSRALVISTAMLVDEMRQAMRGVRYDTLVGTGMSGALVVPRLATALRKHWLIIRKPRVEEPHHGGDHPLGFLGTRWVLVDDFVSTGTTLRRVKDAVRSHTAALRDFETTYVGVYVYQREQAFYPADRWYPD